MIATLLLAAGASSRMAGRDKLLEPVQGQPLLALLAERALTIGPCFVTLPGLSHPRRSVLPRAAQVVIVDITKGMSQSLKSGIAALASDATGAIVLPADMPDISAQDLQTLRDRALKTDASILRATTQHGTPGHPVYFAARLFPEFKRLQGDIGAAAIIEAHRNDTETITLAGDRARLDLDTPEDWAAYRARAPQDD